MGSSGSFAVFSGVFVSENVHRVGDVASRVSVMVHVQKFFRVFLNVSLRSVSCIDAEFLFVAKNKTCGLGIPCSSARLPGYMNCHTSYKRNSVVIIYLLLLESKSFLYVILLHLHLLPNSI